MLNQPSLADFANAMLGGALPLAYGYNDARGNELVLHEATNKKRTDVRLLAEGEWDGIERLWINAKLVDHTDTSLVRFHPGQDGILGHGLTPDSTGGDQKVDTFFNNLPANIQPITFSRMAYLMCFVPPDPAAPSATLDILGHYRCNKVRIFDSTGAQTSYAFSTNPVWQILDMILRVMLKPEWNTSAAAAAGGDLTATEKSRINFTAAAASAAACDTVLANGNKRFETSFAFTQPTQLSKAIDQVCTMAQLYVFECTGQIYISNDNVSRASTFILTSDHIVPGTVNLDKQYLRGAYNRLIVNYRDLMPLDSADIDTAANSGLVRSANVVTVKTVKPDGTALNHPYQVGDNVQIVNPGDASFAGVFPVASVPSATTFTYAQTGSSATSGSGYTGTPESRFAQRSIYVDHEQHQQAIGQRGIGLTQIFRVQPNTLDFGNNTGERVKRALMWLLQRNLGMMQSPYIAPFAGTLTAYMHAVDAQNRALIAQLQGDILTIDATVSEEFQGDYEIMSATLNMPAGDSGSGQGNGSSDQQPTIQLKLMQCVNGAYTDGLFTFTAVRSAISRGGLAPIAAVLSSGTQQLAGSFKNNPTNTNGQFTGANPLSQSANTSTILIASSTLKFGDGSVSYSSGSVNVGINTGRWYVYCRDPQFAGGSVTYLATQTVSDLTQFNDIISFGVITLVSSGTPGTGSGGGGGGNGGIKLPQ